MIKNKNQQKTKKTNLKEQIMKNAPDETEITLLTDFFSIFADETRLRIIYALSQNEMCVQDITKTLMMKQPAISHQLALLWKARVVKKRKDGNQVFYCLDDNHIEKIFTIGYEHINE